MGRAQFIICCTWLVLCLKYVQMLPCGTGSDHSNHNQETLFNYVGSSQSHDLSLRIQIDHQSSRYESSCKNCSDYPVKPNPDTPKNFGYPLDFLWIFDFKPNIDLPQPMYIETPDPETIQPEETTESTETETETETPELTETTDDETTETPTAPEDTEPSESPDSAETTRIIHEVPPYIGRPPYQGVSNNVNSHMGSMTIPPNYLGCTVFCP